MSRCTLTQAFISCHFCCINVLHWTFIRVYSSLLLASLICMPTILFLLFRKVFLRSFALTFCSLRFYVLYFCTLRSVMPFRRFCHNNVFADVENWTFFFHSQLCIHPKLPHSIASLFLLPRFYPSSEVLLVKHYFCNQWIYNGSAVFLYYVTTKQRAFLLCFWSSHRQLIP